MCSFHRQIRKNRGELGARVVEGRGRCWVLVLGQESCPAVSPGWSSPSQTLARNEDFPRPAAAEEKVSPPPEITAGLKLPCLPSLQVLGISRVQLPGRPASELLPKQRLPREPHRGRGGPSSCSTPPTRRSPPVRPHRRQTKRSQPCETAAASSDTSATPTSRFGRLS